VGKLPVTGSKVLATDFNPLRKWARKGRVAGYSPGMYKILVDAIKEMRTYN
jgi:hypothetical protein